MRYFKLKRRTAEIEAHFNAGMHHMLHPDYTFMLPNGREPDGGGFTDISGFQILLSDVDEVREELLNTGDIHLQYRVTSSRALVTINITNSTGTNARGINGTDFAFSDLEVTSFIPKNYYKFKDSAIEDPTSADTQWIGEMIYMQHPGFIVKNPVDRDSTRAIFHGKNIRWADLERTSSIIQHPILQYVGNTGRRVAVDLNSLPTMRSLSRLRITGDFSLHYFKFNDRILEGGIDTNTHTGLDPSMEYMFHPDYRFVLTGDQLSGSKKSVSGYNGEWYIHFDDLVRAEEPACGNVITYSTRDNPTLLLTHDIRDVTGTDRGVDGSIMKGHDYISPSGIRYNTRELVPHVARSAADTLQTFGPAKEYSVSFYNDYLKDQIRTRYAFLDRERDGQKNLIVDSLFPKLMYNYGMSRLPATSLMRSTIPGSSVAISPFCASLLNIKQMEIEQICEVLGYSKADIGVLCRRVKKKNKHFVFVGAGGTNVNTAHWLAQMCKMTATTGLFKNVTIYEKDDAELSNLLRFPKDPATIRVQVSPAKSKINIIYDDVDLLSRSTAQTSSTYIPEDGAYPGHLFKFSKEIDSTTGSIVHDGNGNRVPIALKDPDTILYGAPSIESRDEIGICGNFICATHADSSCSMWLNPVQGADLNIQIESYGMIQLGTFFMNQAKMAITLLEILGTNEDKIDYSAKDVELLDYSFDGTIKGTTDRDYSWQIAKDITMTTTAQAAQ